MSKKFRTITAVRLDTETRGIVEVKLDNGKEVPIQEAIDMCFNGDLDPSVYRVGNGPYGQYLATHMDTPTTTGEFHVNLKDLPQF